MDAVREASDRVRSERRRLGWSAQEVAERVCRLADEAGDQLTLTQQGVSKFENGKSKSIPRWMRYFDRLIAGAGTSTTTPSDGDAAVVMLGVVLPPEHALTEMFAALLAGLPAKATLDERAQLLARRLPIGLSQARDLLPTPPTPARVPPRAAAPRQREPIA